MSLLDDIGYTNEKIISLVGGGGKTTIMYRLARELHSMGKKVTYTTTTHILRPDMDFPFPVIGKPMPDNTQKLSSPSEEEFASMRQQYDVLLVESDGSRGLPLKLPADHEPVLLPDTELVLCIAGIDAVGKPIEKICHRPQLVCDFLQKSMTSIITPEDVAKILPMLCGKRKVQNMKPILVLNKVETNKDKQIAEEISSYLTNYYHWKGVPLIMTGYTRKSYSPPRLIIAGGGHVGLATAKIASIIGMEITIIEPRPELSATDRFPMADHIICEEFTDALKQDFGENSYYVIVTRGHSADMECLNLILQKPYRYVGMIGSRKKTAYVMAEMKKIGWNEETLKKVHSPIGLNIGAVTPEEIAVSIVAEIIQEMNKNGGEKMPADVAKALNHLTETVVMATIIHKEGSAPRGEGSCMLIHSDGSITGTIGGGTVEYTAIQDGLSLLKTGGCIEKEYNLNLGGNDTLNMACGGKVKVLLECVSP